MFDIDGVFVRGKEVFSHSSEALQLLLDRKGHFKVPTVFVTNAGNTLRSQKADQLSERLGIKVSIVLSVILPFLLWQSYSIFTSQPKNYWHQFVDT